MTTEYIILLGAGVILLGALVYLVAAFLVKRVTYLPDGTRIVYYPLAPGMWVEEGPQILHRTKQEALDRNEQIRRHVEGLRRAHSSIKRVVPRSEQGPVGPRLRRLVERGLDGLENSLR